MLTRRNSILSHAVLVSSLGLASCFGQPDYVGRSCDPSEPCPSPLVCSANNKCQWSYEEPGPSDLPDAGGVDGRAPSPLETADASTRPDGAVTEPRQPDGGTATPLCSKRSEAAISFDVINHCMFPVRLAWLDTACVPRTVVDLAPGTGTGVSSYVSHEFVVTNPSTADVVLKIPPLEGPRSIVTCRELLHRYSFDTDARDSVRGANASLLGGAQLRGGAVELDGISGYVNLPIGATIANLDSATFEAWFRWYGPTDVAWARIFDFGNGPGRNLYFTTLSPSATSGFAMNSGSGDLVAEAYTYINTGVIVHMAATIDARTGIASLYIDDELTATRSGVFAPSQLGFTNNNWLGRSQYSDEPLLFGEIHEVRIYRDALDAADIAKSFQIGPNALPSL